MTEFTLVKGSNHGDVKIYTLSTCGWCRKTKEFLNERDVQYRFIDVDLLPDEEMDVIVEQQMSYNPAGSFPTIVINGNEVIVGYDEKKLQQLADN